MTLYIVGKVARNDGRGTAVQISRHMFKEGNPEHQTSLSSGLDGHVNSAQESPPSGTPSDSQE